MKSRKSSTTKRPARVEAQGGWTFLTNHAHVLFCLAAQPEGRVREVAERVGVTERAVLRIIGELEAEGYVRRVRDGRRNRYEVHGERPLRHPLLREQKISVLLGLAGVEGAPRAPRAKARRRPEER